MKVFNYNVYDDDFYSANRRTKNERSINVLAANEHEAKKIMLKNYPENGIGKNNFKFSKIVCTVHHSNTPSV